MRFTVPKAVEHIQERYSKLGYSVYVVGGAVRNLVLGLPPSDWDLATDAPPEIAATLFRSVIPTGIKHGTVTIILDGAHYEITTFRVESDYKDRRRPDTVSFASTIDEDVARRDFTINGMAISVKDGSLIDLVEGRMDCSKKMVRAIGDPRERFSEDALRMMRAFRFAAQLDFQIETDTYRAIQENASLVASISAERIMSEFFKLILSPRPARTLILMQKSGLLEQILPELSKCCTTPQQGSLGSDVFLHLVHACEAAPADSLDLRLAALFHDIAKPACVKGTWPNLSFLGHDKTGAEMAEAILHRLKAPSKLIDRVCRLIRHHMFNYQPEWSDAAVRRWIKAVGEDLIEDLFVLRRADRYGKDGYFGWSENNIAFQTRIDLLLKTKPPLNRASLAVNGNDLAREVGIPAGPEMKVILDYLLEAVIDDPAMNQADRLFHLARQFRAARLKP